MSRKKIALIGAGQIGGTLALLICQKKLGDVVLFDVNPGVAQGKALDISQMACLMGSDTQIIGTNNYQDIQDSDICIITAGFPRKPGMSRDDLLQKNLEVLKQVAHGIKTNAPDTFTIMVTNPLDIMVYAYFKLTGFAPEKIIGMAGVLDSARFSMFLAQELGVSRQDISTMVLGGHGDDMVPLTRFTTVSGVALTEFLEQGILKKQKLEKIIERTRKGGGEIVKLLGTGSAYYAPALAAISMAESYLFDQKRILPCASFLTGQYDTQGLFVGVPTKIGKSGVEKIIELKLTDQERAAFQTSKNSVQKIVHELESML